MWLKLTQSELEIITKEKEYDMAVGHLTRGINEKGLRKTENELSWRRKNERVRTAARPVLILVGACTH